MIGALLLLAVGIAHADPCVCRIMSLDAEGAPETLIRDLAGAVRASCPADCKAKCAAASKPMFTKAPFLCAYAVGGIKLVGVTSTCSSLQPFEIFREFDPGICRKKARLGR